VNLFTTVNRRNSFEQRSKSRSSQKRGQTLALSFLAVLAALLIPSSSAAQNIISTYAGSSPNASGVAPSAIDLPGPTAAIRDASGNTYIASPSSTDVFELTNGLVLPFAGQGYGGFGGDKGPASQSILALPSGLAIDSKGNIYIVDPGNSRVRMVSPSGTITTFAGSGVKCEPNTAPCGDGGPATQADFNLPMAIAFDAQGNAYIADSFDNRVRVVNTQSSSITVFGVTVAAGNIATVAGSVNVSSNQCTNPTSACGDGGVATSALLYFPEGVGFDTAGNLYIADTRDNRIRIVNPTTGVITAFAGSGAICNIPTNTCGDGAAALSAKMHFPTSVYLDSSNNIYVADSLDHKIRLVTASTSFISTVAGTGVGGFNGDGAATTAELNIPSSVFLDSAGNLVIGDTGNQRVRQLSSGNISTVAGGGNGGDNGLPTAATLANPYNVAEDSAGNLYIADTANNRIRKVLAGGGSIVTVAGTGIAGYTGDSGPATSATLNGPTGVTVDAHGNFWIADAGNLVIRRVDGTTGNISTYAGNGLSCKPNQSCGDGGPAVNATFSTPQAVALDSAGNLYIVDYTENRVRIVNAVSGNISNFAGSGNTGLACVPNNLKPPNSVLATKANLNHPSGIAIDSNNNVYIDDSYANEVCMVNTAGQLSLYTFSGAGKFGGDGGQALNASQWNPLELAMDPGNNLFIAGGNNSCVRRVDSLTYTIGTVAGDAPQTCIGGFGGDGGLAVSTATKISPQGLVVDGQSNMYIADNANNRIRTVHLTPALTVTPPKNFGAWGIGQTSTPQTVTIKSTGGVDLNMTSFSFGGADPGDFAQTATTCGTLPVNLGVDVTCTVTLTFTPQTYGPRTATFLINDNASGSPQTVNLSGDGPYYTVNANPPSLTITHGNGSTSTITLTVFAGFNQTVNYTVSGCPKNSTCSVNPSSVMPGTPATLTINTSTTTPPGSYTTTVVGKFGALQSWVKIPVTVQ